MADDASPRSSDSPESSKVVKSDQSITSATTPAPPDGGESRVEIQYHELAREFVSQFESGHNPAEQAVSRVITGKHLDTLLQTEATDREHRHLYRMAKLKSQPQFIFGIIVVGLLAIFALSIAFLVAGQGTLLMQVLMPIITLITGALGGYGIGHQQGRRSASEDPGK